MRSRWAGPAEVPDFTPFMQRVKDARPDCFFVFVPAGNHAAAVFKTYAELGMREAGMSLIGPGDITQDTELQGMGDVAVGVVTLGQYQADLDVGTNREFVEAWKKAYGANSTPDFMAAAGYDGMAAIVDAIVEQDGKIDPERTMAIWSGWSPRQPARPVMIDPETRDIVQDMRVNEVYAEDGRLTMRTIDVIPQVKDPARSRRSAAAPSELTPAPRPIAGRADAPRRDWRVDAGPDQHPVRRPRRRHGAVHRLGRPVGHHGPDGLRQPRPWRVRHARRLRHRARHEAALGVPFLLALALALRRCRRPPASCSSGCSTRASTARPSSTRCCSPSAWCSC